MPPDKNANGCGEAELNENSNIDNRFVCNAWPSYATSITKQKNNPVHAYKKSNDSF